MQRMSGIDPMFVYSDTPVTPMEVAYTCVFDPATAPGGYSFEAVRAVLADRVPTMLPLLRRLMTVPLGLDHPRWVEDPAFDLDNHVRRAALPAPGGEAELRAKVAEVMGRPLDHSQPPWEMHVVEGLAGGRVGLIAKVHHSVIDGVAGVQLMAQLLDFAPEGRLPDAASDDGCGRRGRTSRPTPTPAALPTPLPGGDRRPCRRACSWWRTPFPVWSPVPSAPSAPCARSGRPRSAWPSAPSMKRRRRSPSRWGRRPRSRHRWVPPARCPSPSSDCPRCAS